MGGPGGGGDEVAVGVGVVKIGAGGNKLAAGGLDFGLTGWVGAEAAALHYHTGSREKLSTVTDGGDGLFRGGEVLHDFDDARVYSQVFGCTTAGNDQSVVRRFVDRVERRIDA